jgi:hypothetical protein
MNSKKRTIVIATAKNCLKSALKSVILSITAWMQSLTTCKKFKTKKVNLKTHKMNTLENNKLIAEFMVEVDDYWQKDENQGTGEQLYFQPFDTKNQQMYPTEMLFDRDWNWLMEVVKRINITDDYRFSIQINTMDTYVHDAKTNKYIFRSEAKWQPEELLNSVYEAVKEFIKWYNNQKS